MVHTNEPRIDVFIAVYLSDSHTQWVIEKCVINKGDWPSLLHSAEEDDETANPAAPLWTRNAGMEPGRVAETSNSSGCS